MIAFHNVTKAYGNKAVLRGLSFKIQKGSVFSVMGPSGSGKTTLLRLILGLETPDSGQIFGVDLKGTRAVFQEDRLIGHMSARQNVALAIGGKADMNIIDTLLFDLKLPAHDKNPVASYSGGMKRRVAIARGLIGTPSLLVMDEPFTGLDDAIKADVIEVILKYAKNATILFVTHSQEDASALGAKASIMLPGAEAD